MYVYQLGTVKDINKSTTKSAINVCANMPVVLSRLPKATPVKTETDINGKIKVDNLPPGNYQVTVSDGTVTGVTTVTVNGNVDAGIITPVTDDMYNFKTSMTSDEAHFFGDKTTHDLKIHIKNIGKAKYKGATYKLTKSDNYIDIQSTLEGTTGTIVQDAEEEIDFQFIAKSFVELGDTGLYHDEKIDIEIKDIDNHVWNDFIIIRIYRNPVIFYMPSFTSGSTASGFIIYPDHSLQRIKSGTSEYQVPYDPAATYMMLLSCQDVNDETYYQIGINTSERTDGNVNECTWRI